MNTAKRTRVTLIPARRAASALPPTAYTWLHPDDRESTQAAVDRALDPEGDGHYFAEYRVVARGTRGVRWIEASGTVNFEDGKPQHMVGTVRDITETRQVQEDLRRADRRKDEFLATLGHELRNPLAALVNSVECLRIAPPGDETGELYDLMSRQTAHMTTLLNDLLDIARITRGDVELRRQRLPLAEQLEKAVATVAPEIEAGGHELDVQIEPQQLEVVADPVRLDQILVNLLSNAARYATEPGTVTVRARKLDGDVEIVVEDTGIGFTPGQGASLFEFFYQARKGSGGLGIGLSLVRSLVDLHGGTIEARSEGPGLGSTFRLTLPDSGILPRERAQAKEVPQDLSQLRALVVDDHEDSLRPLRTLLADHCEVRTATTGTEGIAEARRFLPDVILLDLALPDLSGFDVAASIRQVPELQGVVLIAMTGFGDSETAREVSAAGFQHHLTKPVSFQRLLDLLGQAAAARPGR